MTLQEKFNYLCRVTYLDQQNQAVLDRLLREVKALNPVFLNRHIKGNKELQS